MKSNVANQYSRRSTLNQERSVCTRSEGAIRRNQPRKESMNLRETNLMRGEGVIIINPQCHKMVDMFAGGAGSRSTRLTVS